MSVVPPEQGRINVVQHTSGAVSEGVVVFHPFAHVVSTSLTVTAAREVVHRVGQRRLTRFLEMSRECEEVEDVVGALTPVGGGVAQVFDMKDLTPHSMAPNDDGVVDSAWDS